jgi:hypothetical protein
MIGEGSPAFGPAARPSVAWGSLGGLLGAVLFAFIALATCVAQPRSTYKSPGA